ncbi:hypothetical protein HanPI659440_Chr10g0399151 [Helianthus annuus]|nr:hypothetical protein HanPI659440_Chr10g0399151 [Helianthus annuus]
MYGMLNLFVVEVAIDGGGVFVVKKKKKKKKKKKNPFFNLSWLLLAST